MEVMLRDQTAQLVQDVEDGNESALKGFAILKGQISFLQECLNQIEPQALDEALRHGKKTFEDHGFKFEIRSGAKRFDFSNIAEWSKLKDDMKAIEEERKSAWAASQKGITPIDSEGEIIVLPEVKYSKDSIIVK